MDKRQYEQIKKRFEEVSSGARSDDEAYRAILGFFREQVTFPLYAAILEVPVTVTDIEYDGNPRLGLTTLTLRRNRQYRFSLLDLDFPPTGAFSAYQAAYRGWAGWKPPARQETGKKAEAAGKQEATDLVIYAVRERTASCRLIDSEEEAIVHLSSGDLFSLVPCEIISIVVRKTWHYGKKLHVSGNLLSHRLDFPRLGLTPLRLEDCGEWDPQEYFAADLEDTAEEDIDDYLVPIIAAGARSSFEMEQVVPGDLDPDADGPILEAVYCEDNGDPASAQEILMKLLQEDLRCLDAYAHLGNIFFDTRPEKAIQYYEMGMKIGEMSLPPGYNGVLLWGHIDNRPYLRCLHGYGLCLWRLERFAEAQRLVERLLWLNPPDNLGIRFIMADIKGKNPWRPDV